MTTLPKPASNLAGTAQAKAALKLDVTQFALDLAGIVDPTGAADVASAAMSLWRGDWVGAGISCLGLFHGLGDLAKLGKLRKYAESVEKAVALAKVDKDFAALIKPPLRALKGVFHRLPMEHLPNEIRQPVQRIKYQIDSYLTEVPPAKSATRLTRELVVATTHIDTARNKAVEWLVEKGVTFGPHHKLSKGRLGAGKDAFVGVESTGVPYWRIRVDFDPQKGPHYNVEFGKGGESRAFTFPAPAGVADPERWITQIIQRLGDASKR
ncbi:MAG: hypothetical protein ABW321_01615 [Polyangiales bacterium]